MTKTTKNTDEIDFSYMPKLAEDSEDFRLYCRFIEGDTIRDGRRKIGVNRARARSAIRDVVQCQIPQGADRALILELVDRAYPFGDRPTRWNRQGSTQYKAWLKERQMLVQAISGQRGAPTTADEFEAWNVASDLVEQADDLVLHGGNADEMYEKVLLILEAQVPHRYNRECMSCGASVGVECVESVVPGSLFVKQGKKHTAPPNIVVFNRLVLPHMVRVLPPEQSPDRLLTTQKCRSDPMFHQSAGVR